MKLHQFISPRLIHVFFVFVWCGYLVIGLLIHADYGVPIDEYSQMDLGRVNYERIAEGSMEIQQHYDRHYGPAFEVPLYMFSTFFGDGVEENVMALRHLGIFSFFAASLVCFYLLIAQMSGHPLYGFLGAVLLAVYPRFFAESFYNTKDMAFVSATVFVLFSLCRYAYRSPASLLLLAATSAFAVAVRAQGLLLALVVTGVLLIDVRVRLSKRVMAAVLYLVITALVAVGLFPLFWNNTIQNMVDFWRVSANSLGVATYYFGTFVTSPELPWHYHFVWVGISSMLSVLAGSVVGIIFFVSHDLMRGRLSGRMTPLLFGMFGVVVGTFIISVFFHPRSYDGWRHIYYIYPCLVGFAVYGVRMLMNGPEYSRRRRLGIIFGAVMLIDIALSLRFVLRNHPNQHVYFNILAGGYSNARNNFDFDYWGVSQKQLLEHLLSDRFTGFPAVYFQQVLPYTKRVMIPALERRGMRVVPSVEEADLYVTINRDSKDPPPEPFRKIYAVTVEGADVSAIYASSSFRK